MNAAAQHTDHCVTTARELIRLTTSEVFARYYATNARMNVLQLAAFKNDFDRRFDCAVGQLVDRYNLTVREARNHILADEPEWIEVDAQISYALYLASCDAEHACFVAEIAHL